MKMRGRKTGESDEDYDGKQFSNDPDYKPKPGSSIGWDTDTDGLGGAEDG